MNFDNLGWMILKISGQASVLIVFVLAIQWTLSSKIPVSWRYALWTPVVLRLLLPVAPESRFSMFNLLATSSRPVAHENLVFRTIQTDGPVPVIPSADRPVLPPRSTSRRLSAMEVGAGIWLIVALSFMARAVVAHIRLEKILRRARDCRDERICRILEESRRALGVWKELSVIEHPMIGSPALFGLIKPRLLLPLELNSRFSDAELRHIFLHELAHLKRRDLWTNWLLIITQALHWFNPLVWFAARRIRADREFACDAMALEHANESTPIQFGETMVKVLQLFGGSRSGLETISVVRDTAELKNRIQRIATWQPRRSQPLIWCALLGVICLAGLSDVQTETGHSNPKDAQISKQSLPSNDSAHAETGSSPGNSAALEFYAEPFGAKYKGDLKGELEDLSEKSEIGKKAKTKDDAVVFLSSAVPRDDRALYSRTFKVDPDTFLKAVRNRLRPADSIRPNSVQLEIREFFEGVGVQFSKTADGKADQERKSMFFNEKTGILLARTTLADLDMIEDVVRQTQPKAWAFQVKLTMRVTETAAGSKLSGAELIDASTVAASMKPLVWKTNATENSAPIISTVIKEQDWNALLKSFERQRVFDLMTSHETTIPSGTEIAVSIGGEASKDNKADVRLISTVLGENIILTTGFTWTDTGHVDPLGNTFSVNAIGYITRKVFATTRLTKGQTVILSVPRAFQDGKDLLLFITPRNLGASPK
jgi:beta-lactamase regulating signal transducer with metallopeptidase domain